MAEDAFHFMVSRKQRLRKGPGDQVVISDLLLPTKPHLLKFTEPLKITPPAGDQLLNT
jgi:hypothetical protein